MYIMMIRISNNIFYILLLHLNWIISHVDSNGFFN